MEAERSQESGRAGAEPPLECGAKSYWTTEFLNIPNWGDHYFQRYTYTCCVVGSHELHETADGYHKWMSRPDVNH
jgi:hypothetical protein